MFGIGGFELFIILLFGFLVFGPDKLPDIARTIGVAIGKFRKAQEEMNAVLKNEVLDPDADRSSTDARTSRTTRSSHPQETFAQRKARYDRERAAREQREQIQANREQMKRDAARARDERLAQAKAEQSENAEHNEKPDQETTSPREASSKQHEFSADELFGNKPMPTHSRTQDEQQKESSRVLLNHDNEGGA